MRESGLSRRIRERLNVERYCLCLTYHGHAFGLKGHSDLYGVIDGRAFFLEVKVPGEEASPLQAKFLRDMERAGAIVGVVTSVDEALSLLLVEESEPAEWCEGTSEEGLI